MIIRNENDILSEVLNEHLKYCDHIFILDGTDENPELSKSICTGCKNTTYYTDNDLPSNYPRPIRDGCRQFLLDKIRNKFGFNNWIAILHGDELFVDDPRAIIKKYDRYFEALTLDTLLYFIHKEQLPFKLDPSRSFQEQIYWYVGPGWPEARLFKNKKNSNYKDISQLGKVIPEGLNINYKTTFKIKHYTFRNPEQQSNRAKDRVITNKWSTLHYSAALNQKYYLNENDFGKRFYYWISKKPVKPRINDPLLLRLMQDLSENFSKKRIR